MTEVKRAVRVAGRLREELARELRDLSDPRVEGVLLSRVEMTDDLQLARVFVRMELGVSDEKAKRRVLEGLTAAGPRLRRVVGKTLKLRTVPNLKFYYDENPDKVSRVEELLREIKDDDVER